jgi:hypothetical protein
MTHVPKFNLFDVLVLYLTPEQMHLVLQFSEGPSQHTNVY